MDGGITISTAQGIGAIVFLVGTIGTLLGVIRHQYEQRIADLKADNREALREKDEALDKLERRIERMEERDTKRSELIEHNQSVLERAVDLLDRQTVVTETALARPPRRRTAGSD